VNKQPALAVLSSIIDQKSKWEDWIMTKNTLASRLGALGVFTYTDLMPAADAAKLAQRIEEWGYGALWVPDVSAGRDSLVHSSWMLANTARLILVTGIINIYGRDATAMVGAQVALAEQSDNRFVLGLGVSHKALVEGMRGDSYSNKPVTTMKAYLEAMGHFPTESTVQPSERPPVVLAALGPKMLELAASHADGAYPNNTTPAHTAIARKILGPDKLLCVNQMIALETDSAKARATGRAALSWNLTFPNYCSNWRRLGFEDSDFVNGGSDRLIDEIVAWGDEDTIRARIQEHWDAGADHVCIMPLNPAGAYANPDEKMLETFAPAR
jgi:probable F420-dependent oxidoreductase